MSKQRKQLEFLHGEAMRNNVVHARQSLAEAALSGSRAEAAEASLAAMRAGEMAPALSPARRVAGSGHTPNEATLETLGMRPSQHWLKEQLVAHRTAADAPIALAARTQLARPPSSIACHLTWHDKTPAAPASSGDAYWSPSAHAESPPSDASWRHLEIAHSGLFARGSFVNERVAARGGHSELTLTQVSPNARRPSGSWWKPQSDGDLYDQESRSWVGPAPAPQQHETGVVSRNFLRAHINNYSSLMGLAA